jgi:hypothetical protein
LAGSDKEYSEKEAQRRFEAALKGAMSTSAMPLKKAKKVAKKKRATKR